MPKGQVRTITSFQVRHASTEQLGDWLNNYEMSDDAYARVYSEFIGRKARARKAREAEESRQAFRKRFGLVH